MNYVEEIFNRCSIETLCEFLMHGSELLEAGSDGYYERLKKSEKSLSEWLHKQYTDSKELDENFSFIYSVLGEIQSIYMQIGLQAGIMLAAEFSNKKNKT